MKMEFKHTGNTYEERRQNSDHHYYNIFMENSRHLHVYSIQLLKITFKFQIAKIMPLHFCQQLIHLELLIFMQVEFLQFETGYSDYKEMFRFWNRLQWLARKCFLIWIVVPLAFQSLSSPFFLIQSFTWSSISSDIWTSFFGP